MKYKKIPKSYLKICLDRLTRFKPVYKKYDRVFNDIIAKFVIFDPKSSKEPEDFTLEKKCEIVEEIFNASVPFPYDPFITEVLAVEEKKTFKLDEIQEKFLKTKLNLTGAVEFCSDEDDLPLNLKILSLLVKNRGAEIEDLRRENRLLFPVKKVILTEGATEEILLPVFGEIFGFNFNENGVFVLGAGGKNQVARKYYGMRDEIKLPVFILLDYDADETMELILPKLKEKDRIYKIQSGEFEDILPVELIINSINKNFANGFQCSKEDFSQGQKMTLRLHELFKSKGFGEYKKAEFAKIVKNYLLQTNAPLDAPKIQAVIEEIKKI